MSKFKNLKNQANSSKGFSNAGGQFMQPDTDNLYGASKSSNFGGADPVADLDPMYSQLVIEVKRTDTVAGEKNAILFNAVYPNYSGGAAGFAQPSGVTVKVLNSQYNTVSDTISHDVLRNQILSGAIFTAGSANFTASSSDQRDVSWQYYKLGLGGAGQVYIPVPAFTNFSPMQQQSLTVDIKNLNLFVGPSHRLEIPMVPATTSASKLVIAFNISAIADFDALMRGAPIIQASKTTFVDQRGK